MDDNFNHILESLLSDLDNEKEADKIVETAQLSDEGKEFLNKVNSLLDAFEEKAISLENAKKEGKSRRKWVAEQLESITAGCSEDEKAKLINEIGKCEISNSDLEESLTKE